MRIFFQNVQVSTRNRTELVDISRDVEEIVKKSEISEGLCVIYTTHSTAAIVVNEHEVGLMNDIVKKVQQDFPKGVGWLHDRVDDNADAHLASSFLGPTTVIPVRNASLVRGTWQNIFLLELDGPRARKVIVEVMGE
jgi:secondary thiamine-phosphate synthase enzyme